MITYETEGVKFPNIKKRETSNWIRRVAESYGKKIGEIGYMFVNDDKILEVNNEFLGHDYYTDIITFDNREDPASKKVDADIFISVDTVRANGQEYGEGFERELHRVIAHGLLHLTGYDDTSEKEQKKMRSAENASLELLDTLAAQK